MENPKKLRILLLEDSSDDAELVERALKKGNIDFVSKRVESEQDYIDSIRNFAPDVILSDHALPQFNSMEAFKIAKEEKTDIPFLLVTGTVSEEFAVTCLKEGVDDYILKSNLTRLPVAVQHAIHQNQLERNKRMSEKALKEQNNKLLKINRELDNFTYNISHNLKSPLVSVLGLLNLIKLEDQKKDSQFMEMINLMEGSIEKLNNTLVNILNHSRNTRTKIMAEPVNIRSLIEKCYDELKFFKGADRISKKVTIEGSPEIYSDTYRLDVIINNLLSNSIKYMDEEKESHYLNIVVEVTDQKVSFVFEDNGIGIANSQLPTIFDMFTRATEVSNGSGLGLYIVKEIVELLNGEIVIESEEKIGTKVKFYVPNLKGQPVQEFSSEDLLD